MAGSALLSRRLRAEQARMSSRGIVAVRLKIAKTINLDKHLCDAGCVQ
jgi:hypothetical protein